MEASSTLMPEDQRVDKMTCAFHGVHVMHCFELHHQPVEAVTLKLRMPCGHLCDRPETDVAFKWCDGGETKWKLKLVENGRTWNAWRV